MVREQRVRRFEITDSLDLVEDDESTFRLLAAHLMADSYNVILYGSKDVRGDA